MIIGISGDIGSGKSHTQLKEALNYCDRFEKNLVTNFPVNLEALGHYCKLKRLKHCQKMVSRGWVSTITSPFLKGKPCLEALFIPEAVVCLDEAGIFLNSRQFSNTSQKLLADLCQSRKDGIDLIWASQFNDQVDRQFRLLTQYWVHCDGVSVYDKKLRRPRLHYKRIYWFKAADYNDWVEDRRARTSHFKTRFSFCCDYEGGFLNQSDRVLFGCFNSFARLDEVSPQASIHTNQECRINTERRAKYVSYNHGEHLQSTPSPQPPKPHQAPAWGGNPQPQAKEISALDDFLGNLSKMPATRH